MLLRTTISKISKVCSRGFVLRDDFCNGTASYAVIRKAHKSTKSSDDEPGPTNKVIDFSTLKGTSLDTTTGIPLTHHEKCVRIIDQAFRTGPTESDRENSELCCSHTVNIEAASPKIQEVENARMKLHEQNMKIENPMISEDGQNGIFELSRNNEFEIMTEEDVTKKAPPTDTLTQEEASPQTLVNKELVKSFNMALAEESDLKIDDLKKILVVPAPPEEPNLDCAKVDHKLNIINPVMSDTVENKAELCDINADAENTAVNPDHKRVLNVTTAEESEEKLAQKLETIEETPLVEAQKPGIEGFNLNPKVLGDQLSQALICENINEKQSHFEEDDLLGTCDEVAKSCKNEPLGQIDEMLVKEMEKMDLPLTSEPENKTPSTLIGDELVEMDVLNAELKDEDEKRGNMLLMSPRLIHHIFGQLKLPDFKEQDEEMTIFDDIEPLEEES